MPVKNVERRRRIRKTVPFVVLGAVLLLVIGAALLLILPKRSRGKEDTSKETELPLLTEAAATAPATLKPVASPTDAPTDTPTEAASEEPTEYPAEAPTAAPTDTPKPTDEPTASPTEEPTEEPTGAPDETAYPPVPVRISDEMSSVLILIKCRLAFDANGEAMADISGSAAMELVNNTDSVLYSAEFMTGDLKVSSLMLNGVPVLFEEREGSTVVPFVNELKQGASYNVYFEFSARMPVNEAVIVLSFWYDTTFAVTAYVDSELVPKIPNGGAEAVKTESGFRLEIVNASMGELTLLLGY